MSQDGTKVIHAQSKNHAYWPWLAFILKWFWIFVWGYFVILQLQTTESIFAPNIQYFDLMQLNISSLWDNIPYYGLLVALITEALYLTAALSLKKVLINAAKSHEYHVNIVGALIVFGVVANILTDVMFGPSWYPPVPFVGHLLYALIAESVIIYSPIFSNAV